MTERRMLLCLASEVVGGVLVTLPWVFVAHVVSETSLLRICEAQIVLLVAFTTIASRKRRSGEGTTKPARAGERQENGQGIRRPVVVLSAIGTVAVLAAFAWYVSRTLSRSAFDVVLASALPWQLGVVLLMDNLFRGQGPFERGSH